MEAGTVKKKKKTNPAHEVGDEILEEIVLRLPVKSVIRFSCVSKSWSSAISSSRFIMRYRAREQARERVLMVPFNPKKKKRAAAYSGFVSPKMIDMRYSDKIVIPFQKGPNVSYIAQCEGLLCVTVDSNLHLWNPSDRSYKKLAPSPSPLNNPLNDRRRLFVLGLGYDSVGHDYKLLLIPKVKNKESELYSLKTNSWRKIPSFHKTTLVRNQMCAFLKGALHWVDSRVLIVSFNLTTEKYVELVAPKYDDDSTRGVVEVSVLKGKLCATHKCGDVKFVVWLMEDYGMGTSWMKMLEIDYNMMKPFVPYPRWYMRPIYLYDNGNLLAIIQASRSAADQIMVPQSPYYTRLYLYKKRQATLKNLANVGKRLQYVFISVESLVHL